MSEIDELRQQMAQMRARLDHYERHAAPLPDPEPPPRVNGAHTSRIDHWYLANKPSLAAQLRSRLATYYADLSFSDNLARGITFDGASTVALADLPRVIAASLTRESIARQELASAKAGQQHGFGGNAARIQRLEVELAARQRHTVDLVRSTTLPPLPDALKAKADALGIKGHAVSDALGGVIAPPFNVDMPAALPARPTPHSDQFANEAAAQPDPRVRPSKEERRTRRRLAMPAEPDRAPSPSPFNDPDARRPGDQRPVRRVTEADRPRWKN